MSFIVRAYEALQSAVEAYEELKARAGRLDFLDLLIKARDLFRRNLTFRSLPRCPTPAVAR